MEGFDNILRRQVDGDKPKLHNVSFCAIGKEGKLAPLFLHLSCLPACLPCHLLSWQIQWQYHLKLPYLGELANTNGTAHTGQPKHQQEHSTRQPMVRGI